MPALLGINAATQKSTLFLTRFIIFDREGNAIAVDQKEHRQIYPKPGWVEHDPLEIWARTQVVMKGSLEKAGGRFAAGNVQIAAVGVTNQRETTVVWDKHTGAPVYNLNWRKS